MRLRAIEPEDLDVLYQIENDRSLWHVGTTNVPYSRYTLHDYIATSSDDIYADRQLRLVIEDDQRQVVGMADLVHFDPQHQRAEAGIVIMQPHRRKGYALSALNALADYALHTVHLHQLYAVVAADNEGNGYHGMFFTLTVITPENADGFRGLIGDNAEPNLFNIIVVG